MTTKFNFPIDRVRIILYIDIDGIV